MFFNENELVLDLIGVFKITRNKFDHESFDGRTYDCLGFRLSGNAVFKYNKVEYPVTTSDIIYLPHNTHYTQSTQGETIISINFINYSTKGNNSPHILHLKNPDWYRDTLCRMYRIWNDKKPGYKNLCTSLLYELLYMTNKQLHATNLTNNSSTIMSSAIEYIHKNYRNHDLSIADLAKRYSVSEAYFRRLFNKTYLTSPLQYITNLRLEYASQLLLSKFYTIKEVAEKTGFNDEKYFSRIFKKTYGIAPRSYVNNFYDNMLDYNKRFLKNDYNQDERAVEKL